MYDIHNKKKGFALQTSDLLALLATIMLIIAAWKGFVT